MPKSLSHESKDGGPAFPGIEYYDEKPVGAATGMSLRDYFAARALMMCESVGRDERIRAIAAKHGLQYAEALARMAYELADAMIAERAK